MAIIETWHPQDKKTLRTKCVQKLDLCGCGTNSHNVILLMLLEKAEDHDKHGSFYDPDDAEYGWIEFGAKVLDAAGLIEHGTGIGFAWLTDEGNLLLKFLREFGTDDGKWPMWAYATNLTNGIEEEFEGNDTDQ